MTQLREEGWIHHLARHAVACFLTRGDLWISWEEGMKVFEELLLDADWSVNAGTWMWLSSSSFFQQFIHCYCPVRFGRKADTNGDFIRKYLPVLRVIKNYDKNKTFNFFFLFVFRTSQQNIFTNHGMLQRVYRQQPSALLERITRYQWLIMLCLVELIWRG